MTKKDPNISENIDLNKTEKEPDSHHTKGEKTSASPETEGHTEIKNAHATGDGAYGRSDKSVLEDENSSEKEEETPPY